MFLPARIKRSSPTPLLNSLIFLLNFFFFIKDCNKGSFFFFSVPQNVRLFRFLHDTTSRVERRESSEASRLIASGMRRRYRPAGNGIRLLFPHFTITNKKKGERDISIFIRSTGAPADAGRARGNIHGGEAAPKTSSRRCSKGQPVSGPLNQRENTASVLCFFSFILQNRSIHTNALLCRRYVLLFSPFFFLI